jgi:hypothetical protein
MKLKQIYESIVEAHAGFSNDDTRWAFISLNDIFLTQFAEKKITPKPEQLKKIYDKAYKLKRKYPLLQMMTDPSQVNFEELANRIVDDYGAYYKGHLGL